jgi:hypothetical protein
MQTFKTLNFGAPGDSAVNPFEYVNQRNAKILRLDLPREAYENADKLDRLFKTGPRQSPLYTSFGMEHLWSTEFSIESYVEKETKRIWDALLGNPDLMKAQLKNAKLDKAVADGDGNGAKDVLLQYVHGLVNFDAACAKAIRDSLTFEEFCEAHRATANVVQDTIHSIVEEELSRDGVVFFLQEINQGIVDQINDMLHEMRPNYSISGNEDGSTAIIFPTAFKPLMEVVAFPEDETCLFKETFVLKYDEKFLFVSTHFSSKNKAAAKGSLKNFEDQMVPFNAFLKTMSESYTVIVGGDFNHAPAFEEDVVEMVVPSNEDATNFKERSTMQVQYRKINVVDSGSKDRIVMTKYPHEDGVVHFVDYRVRSLYKNGKAFCSVAENVDRAQYDYSLNYPVRLKYPEYGIHFPDHDLVELEIECI